MKIVCVMPIYKRPAITIKTLELLKKQELPIHIITIGSCDIDRKTAESVGVEYLQRPNRPLSDKWQYGIYYARQYDPEAIMICGSDAWLTTNWCKVAYKYINDGFDMVGKRDFYTCYLAPNKKVEIIGRTYKTRKDPVGSGRLISKSILNKLNWKLYPSSINASMDGKSFKRLESKNCRLKIITDRDDLIVLSLKSSEWETITPYTKIANHGMFKNLADVGNPADWFNAHFPGAVKELKDIVPTVII